MDQLVVCLLAITKSLKLYLIFAKLFNIHDLLEFNVPVKAIEQKKR